MKIDIYYSLKARNHGTHIQINDSVEEFKIEMPPLKNGEVSMNKYLQT